VCVYIYILLGQEIDKIELGGVSEKYEEDENFV
jgi:hypothetical protein